MKDAWKFLPTTIRRHFLLKFLNRILNWKGWEKIARTASARVEEVTDFPFKGKHSVSDQLASFVFSTTTAGKKRQLIRIRRPDPLNLLEAQRPEVTLARVMGEVRFMQRIQMTLGRGSVEKEWGVANQIPEPHGIILCLMSGKQIVLPLPDEWDSIMVLSPFVGGAESYRETLSKRQSGPVTDTDRTELKDLARLLVHMHGRFEPKRAQLETTRTMVAGIYETSQRYILAKIQSHLSSPDHHPLLAPREKVSFGLLCSDTFRKWGYPSDRLRSASGDMHTGNLLFHSSGKLIPIDGRGEPSFIQYADPGLDVGTLVADLWWLYRLWGNPAFKERARLLLDYYEEASGDDQIRRAVACIGIPLWTAMYMNPRYTSPHELARGRPFFDDMEGIIAAGVLGSHS